MSAYTRTPLGFDARLCGLAERIKADQQADTLLAIHTIALLGDYRTVYLEGVIRAIEVRTR